MRFHFSRLRPVRALLDVVLFRSLRRRLLLLSMPHCVRCKGLHSERPLFAVAGLPPAFSHTLCQVCWGQLGSTMHRRTYYEMTILNHMVDNLAGRDESLQDALQLIRQLPEILEAAA